jgi:uncharacterized protein (TIGR00290 family)
MLEPIVMCWSGGKDSELALGALSRQFDYNVVALLTTVTAGYDRVSMHGVRRSLLLQQAESLGLPLREVEIPTKASNDIYEANMAVAFGEFHAQGIRKVAFGDIFLEDLREYRQRQLAPLRLECLFPLWQQDTTELVETFISDGFRGVTVVVDPQRLDESFVGREIDREFVAALPPDVDPCGENGEFHSFVYDGPMFADEISFSRGEVVQRDSFLFCDLLSDEKSTPASRPIDV